MPRIVIAHPSADVYGSDLQLVETVRGLVEAGWQVVTYLPGPGPLTPLLIEAGSAVREVPFPVLRKALLRPRALPRLVIDTIRSTVSLRRLLRSARPDRVLVNTLTIPTWIAAGRLSRGTVIAHVHEAERQLGPVLRFALAAPLLGAQRVIANSESTRQVLVESVPALASRTVVVHNGMNGPVGGPTPLRDRTADDPATLALIGRLSPRKGTDIALEAVARVRSRGHDARLMLAGSVFEGYEWFEDQLRERAAQPDLEGAVDFLGYTDPWQVLRQCDIAMVPSRVEPFGNVAAEALLAERPLVAAQVQGLAEIVRPGVTGLLVPVDDAEALADAIESLLTDPPRARQLAQAGRADVTERFSVEQYHRGMLKVIVG
jgi:glycosyltransferase involved in cell wall biosynthesis